MIVVEDIRRLDLLFLAAKQSNSAEAWSAYVAARAEVDRRNEAVGKDAAHWYAVNALDSRRRKGDR